MNYLKHSYTWSRRIYYFITGLGMALVLAGVPFVGLSTPLMAAAPTPPEFPTQLYTTPSGEELAIPDFNSVTFGSLPPFSQSGCIDDTRCWDMGASPADVLALSDIEPLEPQLLTLAQVATTLGTDRNAIKLDDVVGLLALQTLSSLVAAVPGLADAAIKASPYLQDLLTGVNPDQTLAEEIASNPSLEDLPIVGSLDLSQYTSQDIFNLTNAQFGSFANWQEALIGEAYLAILPLGAFPNPPKPVGNVIARADLLFTFVEGGDDGQVDFDRVLTGSNESGMNAPCKDLCGQIELVHPGGSGVDSPLNGSLLVSGDTQNVKGGFGLLGGVNGGREPTGFYPFGDFAKVVVTQVDEKTDTATLEFFFRTCKRGLPDLGCTPYFIGGVPFISIKRDDLILLGLIPPDTGTAPSEPTAKAQALWQSYQGQTTTSSSNQTGSVGNPVGHALTNAHNALASANLPSTPDSSPNAPNATEASDVELAVLNNLGSHRSPNQIGPRQSGASGECSVRVGKYGIPSDAPEFRNAASPELIAALDQLANLAPTCVQTSSPDLAAATDTDPSPDYTINLEQKFYEEFPDGGEAITLDWLMGIADTITPSTSTNATPTEDELKAAVFGGTHLPKGVLFKATANETLLDQTIQQILGNPT